MVNYSIQYQQNKRKFKTVIDQQFHQYQQNKRQLKQ